MKTFTTLLALVLTATFTLTAAAQDVAGSWQAESVSSIEPPEGAALTLSFGDEGKATITYTLAGESQAWQYDYAVTDGQLTLDPTKFFGEPQTVTYDIKFDEGKLLLLTPKPKPAKEEAEETEETEGAAKPDTEDAVEELGEEEPDEASAEEATEEVEKEAEEEDTRVPVWVLIKA